MGPSYLLAHLLVNLAMEIFRNVFIAKYFHRKENPLFIVLKFNTSRKLKEESVDRRYLLWKQLGGLKICPREKIELEWLTWKEKVFWLVHIAGKISRENCLFISRVFLSVFIVWSVKTFDWVPSCFCSGIFFADLLFSGKNYFHQNIFFSLDNWWFAWKRRQNFTQFCCDLIIMFSITEVVCKHSIGKSSWVCAKAEVMIMENLRGNWGKLTNTDAKAETLLWSETK